MASLSLLLPPGSRFPRVFSSPSPPFLFSPLCSPFLPFSFSPLRSSPSPSPCFSFQSSLLLKISMALVRHCIFIIENVFSLESHCLQADEWGGENPSFKSNYTYTSLYSQRNSKGLFTTQREGSLCKAALSEKHKLEYWFLSLPVFWLKCLPRASWDAISQRSDVLSYPRNIKSATEGHRLGITETASLENFILGTCEFGFHVDCASKYETLNTISQYINLHRNKDNQRVSVKTSVWRSLWVKNHGSGCLKIDFPEPQMGPIFPFSTHEYFKRNI